ncbi:hypothetical protein [Aurantibacillus circumpalustris]|uniref:hypothetical protein n=1 Tax=Aurantibacillus circumpalustris TaxID=3036359 RepID=UPI00295BE206|nr:hypothetical protein [Aurantibacillus circumpalustris]
MKKLFTLISILLVHYSFSQTEASVFKQSLANAQTEEPKKENEVTNFQIIINCLPETSDEFLELSFEFKTKGTYSFRLADDMIVRENCIVRLMDVRSGNTFNLLSKEPHSLSVNRSMTKNFILQLYPSILSTVN